MFRTSHVSIYHLAQNPPIKQDPQSIHFEDPNKRNLVAEVSTKKVVVYGKGNTPSIIAYDCGMKYNIIRYLVNEHKVQLTVVPYNYNLETNIVVRGNADDPFFEKRLDLIPEQNHWLHLDYCKRKHWSRNPLL